jgi:DNA-binding IclR family transcriptional regulator
MSNPLERAFTILDIVVSANREMALIEIVQASGLPQSSVFRLAANLVETGMLSFNARNKTYRAGARVRRLSLFAVGQKKFGEVVRPSLEVIARETEETAFFVLRGAEGSRLFDYLVPELGARAFIHPGFAFPIHATAAGKVMAAFSKEDITTLLAGAVLERYQQATITDLTTLSKLLIRVRKQGFATNDSELDPDVYSACAPVYFAGEIAGALGFVGPRDRLVIANKARLPSMLETLKEEADHLSALMKDGSRRPSLSSTRAS